MESKTVKTDCFAYVPEDFERPRNRVEHCACLIEMVCRKKECPFYKPDSEVDKAQIQRDMKRYESQSKKFLTAWEDD